MRMQGYCDVYKWIILKWTSPEVKCLHATSSKHEMSTSSVSNVIYHKFSHGATFNMPNGKNVNVMLEFPIIITISPYYGLCSQKIVRERLSATVCFYVFQVSSLLSPFSSSNFFNMSKYTLAFIFFGIMSENKQMYNPLSQCSR